MFYECSSLSSLPDISKWNTNNVTDMSKIFDGCSSLSSLPNISKWNTNNVTNMNGMFAGCALLSSLPNISKWKTNNVTNMSKMFYGCSSLSSLPEISKWNTNNVTDMKDMFNGCSLLSSLFDFSKIYETRSLLSLFDSFNTICIKTIKGYPFFIHCLNDDTIQDIKNKIEFKEGIQSELQLLFFNGQQLEDNRTLKYYNIPNFSILYLVLKIKKI